MSVFARAGCGCRRHAPVPVFTMTAFFFPAKPLPRLRPLPLALSAAAFLSMPALAQGQDPSSGPAPAAATAASASPQEQVLLPAVEVVGRTASGAYHTDEAAGAKTDLPLRELPQSLRVITRQAMDDLGATKLDDVLDYVGGVSRQNNFGGLWDNIVIRGLPGDQNVGMATLFNGFSSGRGFNAPRDLAGVERIEFLKGTAAALYGRDRKSTRLNSSHVRISYAVFCLKKKKNM